MDLRQEEPLIYTEQTRGRVSRPSYLARSEDMDVELSPDSQRNTSDSELVAGIANPRTIPCDDPEDLSSEIDAASHRQVGPMGAADKNEGLCSRVCYDGPRPPQ
jgi:hypothetical protein